jgi:hypothetical protein
MPPLDYEKPEDRRTRWARLVLPLATALTLLPVLVPVGWIAVVAVRTRSESRKFHAAFTEAQILDQSTAAVRARFGQPDSLTRSGDGSASMTYSSRTTWEYCGIEFHDDKATKVFFWGK